MDEVMLGWYRHFKGNVYLVLGVAKHSETMEDMVVYRSKSHPEQMWVRPKTMFLERVTVDNKAVRRFDYIGPLTDPAERL